MPTSRSEDYAETLKEWPKPEQQKHDQAESLKAEVELGRKYVLNPLCHDDPPVARGRISPSRGSVTKSFQPATCGKPRKQDRPASPPHKPSSQPSRPTPISSSNLT